MLFSQADFGGCSFLCILFPRLKILQVRHWREKVGTLGCVYLFVCVCVYLSCVGEKKGTRFQTQNNSLSLDRTGVTNSVPTRQAGKSPGCRMAQTAGMRDRANRPCGPATLGSSWGPPRLPASPRLALGGNAGEARTPPGRPRGPRSSRFPQGPPASGAAAALPWQRRLVSASGRRRATPGGMGRGGSC